MNDSLVNYVVRQQLIWNLIRRFSNLLLHNNYFQTKFR